MRTAFTAPYTFSRANRRNCRIRKYVNLLSYFLPYLPRVVLLRYCHFTYTHSFCITNDTSMWSKRSTALLEDVRPLLFFMVLYEDSIPKRRRYRSNMLSTGILTPLPAA